MAELKTDLDSLLDLLKSLSADGGLQKIEEGGKKCAEK